MTDDKIMLGPIVYAGLKALKAYREAENVCKSLPTDNLEEEPFLKFFSSVASELQKYSDAPAEDFVKKYKIFESMFSLALKLLG
jgi:hypothetical protein